jgi:hypothetical protein
MNAARLNNNDIVAPRAIPHIPQMSDFLSLTMCLDASMEGTGGCGRMAPSLMFVLCRPSHDYSLLYIRNAVIA